MGGVMSNLFRLFMQHITLLALPVCFLYWQNTLAQTNLFPSTQTQHIATSSSLAERNFVSLQAELALYQAAIDKPWPIIFERPKLKLKAHHQNVGLLRERLKLTGDLRETEGPLDNNVFDHPLADAVKNFQARHGLTVDGIAGVKTLAELNILPQQRIQEIQVNLQRWADLSKRLGDRFVMVNIPEFQLYVYDNGEQVMTMKAIVGKPDLQTPELSSRITRIILNPYWHVPDKIAAKDLAPKVRNDPYYLDDMHIKVFVNNGDSKEEISSQDIDWQSVEDSNAQYSFRQEPGDDNALGQVKFEFPNSHDVYLHDTSARSLFNEPFRALSHGCVRVEKPLDLVAYLMKDDFDWNDDRVQEILAMRKTTYIPVAKPMPVYITYITVWSDENGVVNYRNDIYQRDI
jgi:murein L,D-transpeptidase YcbB/YkuD